MLFLLKKAIVEFVNKWFDVNEGFDIKKHYVRLIAVAYTCIFICINSKCPESKKKTTHMQTNTFYLMFQQKVE
jgi:hypothetical protein